MKENLDLVIAALLADLHTHLLAYLGFSFLAGLCGGMRLRQWLYANDAKMRSLELDMLAEANAVLGDHAPDCATLYRGPFPGPCTCKRG